jgi:hypothetical protein
MSIGLASGVDGAPAADPPCPIAGASTRFNRTVRAAASWTRAAVMNSSEAPLIGVISMDALQSRRAPEAAGAKA